MPIAVWVSNTDRHADAWTDRTGNIVPCLAALLACSVTGVNWLTPKTKIPVAERCVTGIRTETETEMMLDEATWPRDDVAVAAAVWRLIQHA